MRRREFIGLLGSAALAPHAARAQQTGVPVIAYVRSGAGLEPLVAAFRQGLGEVGIIEGQHVAIVHHQVDDEVRFESRLTTLIAELVRRRPAVIVANTVPARAAKAATDSIPIVFLTGADPVKIGLVNSLNRPSGNVTGVTFTTSDITAKRLSLLVEMVPKAGMIGVLLDENAPGGESAAHEVEQARTSIGRQVMMIKIKSALDIADAFAAIGKQGAGAVFVGGGPMLLGQRAHIVALAAQHALPASYTTRQYSEAGGLMSYGPSQTDAYRQAGIYAGRILKGARPSDLPVMRPTKFDMIINLKTAKALGLEVPTTLLARADEVFE